MSVSNIGYFLECVKHNHGFKKIRRNELYEYKEKIALETLQTLVILAELPSRCNLNKKSYSDIHEYSSKECPYTC